MGSLTFGVDIGSHLEKKKSFSFEGCAIKIGGLRRESVLESIVPETE